LICLKSLSSEANRLASPLCWRTLSESKLKATRKASYSREKSVQNWRKKICKLNCIEKSIMMVLKCVCSLKKRVERKTIRDTSE
jgi:hypothetical protein